MSVGDLTVISIRFTGSATRRQVNAHLRRSNPQSTSTTLQVRHCYSFNITGIVFFGGDKISKAIA